MYGLRCGLLVLGRHESYGLRQGYVFNGNKGNELFNVYGMCGRYV